MEWKIASAAVAATAAPQQRCLPVDDQLVAGTDGFECPTSLARCQSFLLAATDVEYSTLRADSLV